MDDELKADPHSMFLHCHHHIEDGLCGRVVADLFGPSKDNLFGRVLCVDTQIGLCFRAIGAIGTKNAELLN